MINIEAFYRVQQGRETRKSYEYEIIINNKKKIIIIVQLISDYENNN